MINGAESIHRKFCDRSNARTTAQLRANTDAPRVRDPQLSVHEYFPTTVLRAGALQLKRTRFRTAYGS